MKSKITFNTRLGSCFLLAILGCQTLYQGAINYQILGGSDNTRNISKTIASENKSYGGSDNT